MFKPRYTISNKLVGNIKRIAEVVLTLNQRRFSKVILFEMEREAREVSSFASTSIEGNPLPLTDVKRILKQTPAHIRDTEREVLNYNQALVQLNDLVDDAEGVFNEQVILKTHRLVMEELLPKYLCGKFRNKPIIVNDPITGKVVFWPPDHQDVSKLIKELFQYLQVQDGSVDSLILAGIFHKQFVLVHPFIDGSGRSVRLATKVLLAKLGLNTFRLFSFERFYNTNVSKYFASVGEKGDYYDLEVDFTSWLEYFTDGVLDELLRVQKELEKTLGSPITGLKAHHQVIVDYIREYGSISDSIYATLTSRAKPTRALDFKYLLDQDLIKRQGKGRATFYTL